MPQRLVIVSGRGTQYIYCHVEHIQDFTPSDDEEHGISRSYLMVVTHFSAILVTIHNNRCKKSKDIPRVFRV